MLELDEKRAFNPSRPTFLPSNPIAALWGKLEIILPKDLAKNHASDVKRETIMLSVVSYESLTKGTNS